MAVVGRILLGILILLPVILLLILFFPFSYRLKGKKTPDSFSAEVRVDWLFGLVRLMFLYPEPGKPQMQIAFITLRKFQRKRGSGISRRKSPENKEESASGPGTVREDSDMADAAPSREVSDPEESPKMSEKETEQKDTEQKQKKNKNKKKASFSDILTKIRSEAEFYLGLWGQDATKALVAEMFLRLGRILKNVFPRKIRGRLLFGASSPDVTGYVYAVYSILSTKFPRRFSLAFEPDFQREVLEGELFIAGRVMLFTVLWNGLRILLDKRMHRLWRTVNQHRK